MANLNKVQIIGKVTRDPEVKFTPKGTAVCEISIAVNRWVAGKDGERGKEEVTYLNSTVWGKQAEFVGEYVRKGREVYLEGRLEIQTWNDKQTDAKRQKMVIVCENIQPLGPKPESGQPSRPSRPESSAASSSASNQDNDEDIPF